MSLHICRNLCGKVTIFCNFAALNGQKTMKTDFLVIGSGAAGLSFALKAAAHGHVTIVTKGEMNECNTNFAQGGICSVLVTGETDDDYIVLTDIQGLEDFFGDMDFKVGGTHEGITAIQMDIKIHGLTRPIIEEAIRRCREARLYIMDNIMAPVISEPRKTLSKYAPKITQITIDPAKIGDVVGKQGKVINKIIEETGVKIDITDDGAVNVCGTDQEMIDKAIATIRNIVTDVEPGMIYTGKVVRIMEFGAFVELAPNKDGMVHISKLSDKRVAKVEDVVNIGDEVTVRVVEVDRMGRINLTMRPEDMTADLEKLTRPERRERSDRPERRASS